MNSAVLPAAISGAVAIIVAALTAGSTFLFTKRREREADWRKMKLDLYKDYAVALSSQLNMLTETRTDYINAVNALTLVAPPHVLEALYAFNDDLFVKQSGSLGERIQALLRALREDIHPSLRHACQNLDLRLFRKSSAQTIDDQSIAGSK